MQYIYYVIYCKKVFCFTSTEFWIWFDIYDWIKSSFQFHWSLNGIVIFLTVWKQSPISFYTPCWCKEHCWLLCAFRMYTWSHGNCFFLLYVQKWFKFHKWLGLSLFWETSKPLWKNFPRHQSEKGSFSSQIHVGAPKYNSYSLRVMK